MTEKANRRKDPVYLLTIGYVVALVIIAVMSLCIHTVIGKVVQEQNSAAVIISARQAQLSQKIAFYASQYMENKDPYYRQRLTDSVELMADSHEALVQGSETMNVPPTLSPELKRVYFYLPYNLDERVQEFLARARSFLAAAPEEIGRQNADYRYLIATAKGPLMTALDAATMAYEAESEERIAKLQSYQRMALFVIFATLVAEAMLIFRPLVTRVHNYAERLKRLAMTDPLTGVDNNRCFNQKAIKELKRSRRHGKPLCVGILDLDNFKQINDIYGHLVGDEVLRTFAQFVQRSMRLEDEFARIGGEEFAVLLPHTNIEGAKVITERIRAIIESSPVQYEKDKELRITVSIGVAEVDPDSPDFEAAMNAADKALYQAKQQGRNRVVYSELYSSTHENVVPLGQQSRQA